MNIDDKFYQPIETSLPELLQAEWGVDQVIQLFDDLRDGAEVEHVQLRAAKDDRITTLAEAKLAFADGSAQAIQVRYRFEGETWCDTILPSEPTTKIIRTRLPGSN
ncbi:MAG: hypothetical protein ABI557_02605 [Aureliella sp.]